MVKECMDPVTCMLPVMLPILLEPACPVPILLEPACPVFVLRFVLLSFTLVGAPYPVGAWLPSPPGCLLPFSLTNSSSPVEALPLSLFRGTCYPSLLLALSIPLAPDLSLPLEPRIWGLRVLRCRLANTLAVIVSSAVLSSFLLSV